MTEPGIWLIAMLVLIFGFGILVLLNRIINILHLMDVACS